MRFIHRFRGLGVCAFLCCLTLASVADSQETEVPSIDQIRKLFVEREANIQNLLVHFSIRSRELEKGAVLRATSPVKYLVNSDVIYAYTKSGKRFRDEKNNLNLEIMNGGFSSRRVSWNGEKLVDIRPNEAGPGIDEVIISPKEKISGYWFPSRYLAACGLLPSDPAPGEEGTWYRRGNMVALIDDNVAELEVSLSESFVCVSIPGRKIYLDPELNHAITRVDFFNEEGIQTLAAKMSTFVKFDSNLYLPKSLSIDRFGKDEESEEFIPMIREEIFVTILSVNDDSLPDELFEGSLSPMSYVLDNRSVEQASRIERTDMSRALTYYQPAGQADLDRVANATNLSKPSTTSTRKSRNGVVIGLVGMNLLMFAFCLVIYQRTKRVSNRESDSNKE